MSRKNMNDLKPFLSIIIIILTLFSMVFFKMEVRRMGYSLLTATQKYKLSLDKNRLKVMKYAEITRPERVRRLAITQLTMKIAKKGQIIQMTGEKIALPQ